ncbi:MAG: chromosome segregation protein SMC [Pseudomonadota bacterium]
MIQFEKLRLSGFKSFVDKTELEISTGLTGIVGPNGCGKSNLVEALRWVMGETSAKRMRGGGGSMEDVIFNGTSDRPARNFAEVQLLLNNSSRSAPAAYNADDEIEITRKIEKDKGSVYKVNGKTTRARDVQMLFADTVTGANSPAMVSQGRVTAMINAKPQERRLVLEESAGVSGLYVRRHEAELRLRAADANLQRLDDLVGSMEGRLGALKKQARQAVRYKNLSEEIADLEKSIAYLEWRILVNKIEKAKAKFGEAESIVAEHMATVTQLTKTQSAQSEEIPALRQEEAEASAALQTQKLTLQRIEDQERALAEQLQETKEQLEQVKEDFKHEQASLEENNQLTEKLAEEEAKLRENETSQEDSLKEKTAIKDRLEEKVLSFEKDYEDLMAKMAGYRAGKQAIEEQIASDKTRLESLRARQETITAELATAKASYEQGNEQDNIKAEITALEEKIATAREERETAQAALKEAEAALDTAREEQQKTQKQKSEIITEIKTLQTVLNVNSEQDFKPVLGDIEADKGFETALSRALGDTLMASTDDDAPMIWLDRDFNESDFAPLPATAQKLEPYVRAPKHLKAALSFIGVVDDFEAGSAAARELKPGQSIVSRDGAYWRWDGFHIKAEAADRHAQQLQQRNRLKELEEQLPAIEQAAESAEEALQAATSQKETAQEKFDQSQSGGRENEEALTRKQNELRNLTEERASLFANMAKFEESLANTVADIEVVTASLSTNEEKLEDFDNNAPDTQEEHVEEMRTKLGEVREDHRQAVRELDMVTQEQSRRKARLHAIADETVSLKNRSIRSTERIKELKAREEHLIEKFKTLENSPKEIVSNRDELMTKIGALEEKRNAAADKLAIAENELNDTNRALKEAESTLSEARETRAGAQATTSAGEEQLEEIVSTIVERFEKQPKEILSDTSLSINEEEEELPAIEPLKEKKEKMIRSRDMIGPVNLRAEQEATELETEVGGVLEERNELIQAIEELREGIDKLNTEARERLMAAFDHVNGHFQRLFVQLYGGGKAHLALIDSDDPLNSGLEIFAQPPGKTLQSLSLLSGGEQTLASIALIFAMFLTNPSPICVLDEIDAPLDDANVDRVCNLLEEIAERGETRFLIITHHRLTMARMDRLYGVTMAERGVSQLVSVDLNQQMDFLEAAE